MRVLCKKSLSRPTLYGDEVFCLVKGQHYYTEEVVENLFKVFQVDGTPVDCGYGDLLMITNTEDILPQFWDYFYTLDEYRQIQIDNLFRLD